MQSPSILFFSDLDGSLLDHHSYSFEPARPALAALNEAGLPLILTTSKTLAEADEINRALGKRQPVIVENGGAICFPDGHDYPFEVTAHEHRLEYRVIRFSPPYAQIRDFIAARRTARELPLTGFGDLDDAAVAAATGLPLADAARARDRLCSEPFSWSGSEPALAAFIDAAYAAGLRVTRGGRYWHLMGPTSKAAAMRTLSGLYQGGLERTATVVALGDGENDREMLHDADIAVVIRRPDGSHLDCHGIRRTIITDQPGPPGWNAAVLQILREASGSQNTT